MANAAVSKGVDSQLLSRILREGYGPGAWHGADIKAAIAGVTDDQAFARLAPGRHNIAEIALHHAYYVHSVRGRLASPTPEALALPGGVQGGPIQDADWFVLEPSGGFSWKDVQHVLDVQYERLGKLIDDLDAGKSTPLLEADGALEVILGITCHSAYHAGQIQLLKVLAG